HPEHRRAPGPDAEPGLRGQAPRAVPPVRRRPDPVRPRPRHPVPVRQPILQEHPRHERPAQLRRGPAHAEPRDHGARQELRRQQRALLRPLRQVHGQDGQHLAAHRAQRRDQEELQEGQPLLNRPRDCSKPVISSCFKLLDLQCFFQVLYVCDYCISLFVLHRKMVAIVFVPLLALLVDIHLCDVLNLYQEMIQ
uniref:Uncharacterized protein n=1 Tax=Triticum urartu TaxID=4572 RepID=A0A8R7VC68_TRIUA